MMRASSFPPKVAPDVMAIVPIFRKRRRAREGADFIDKLSCSSSARRKSRPAAAARPTTSALFFRQVSRPGDHRRLARQPARRQAVSLGAARRALPRRSRPARCGSEAFVLKQRLDRSKETVPHPTDAQLARSRSRACIRPCWIAQSVPGANHPHAESYDEMKKILPKRRLRPRLLHPTVPRTKQGEGGDQGHRSLHPPRAGGQTGPDIFTGEPTSTQVLFALAY